MHDRELAERLRAGDEEAFRAVVTEYGGRLARLARSFTRNDAVVEEAVQETWLAVIRGLHGFEGRAPLRTWIFGILVHVARRLAVREHRHAAIGSGRGDGEPAEDLEREPGMGADGMWVHPPASWGLEDPESVILGRETMGLIEHALAGLPEAQRQAVLLRDVEGMDGEETCNILGVSGTHMRVLLHRGRARLRCALDRYLAESAPGGVPLVRGGMTGR